MKNPTSPHRLGAHPELGGVRFTAWSDRAATISAVIYDAPTQVRTELELEAGGESGLFTLLARGLEPGCLYDFRVDGQIAVDPYARALPYGVHGPARVPTALPAREHPKRALNLDHNPVFYELHIGTFTPEGTFESALKRLPYLRELGVTVIELMPVAAFAGRFGWGYDGVAPFAPHAVYGRPEALHAFVDTAHGLGLGVVLDVVYNHFGPAGNALPAFSDSYFDAERTNAWGSAPKLEDPPFRRLVLDNAEYWLNSFGFDGLRLDATHALEPGGAPHILTELSQVARACDPPALLTAEDERNDPRSLLDYGVDGVWSDDFHHVLHVLLTGEREGYYRAFSGNLAELARVIERGQLFEGQSVPGSNRARGKPTAGVPANRFLFSLQNHDQVGNRAHGERLHHLSNPEVFRAVTLLLCFLPATPLLFMGQEWAASSPFLYFSDHEGELGRAVSEGRRKEFSHFSAFHAGDTIPDPQAESTFLASKLDWSEQARGEHRATLELTRRALDLRRTDPVLRSATQLSAGVAHDCLWVLRSAAQGSRLLLFNPGEARSLGEVSGCSPTGTVELLTSHPMQSSEGRIHLPARSAIVLKTTSTGALA